MRGRGSLLLLLDPLDLLDLVFVEEVLPELQVGALSGLGVKDAHLPACHYFFPFDLTFALMSREAWRPQSELRSRCADHSEPSRNSFPRPWPARKAAGFAAPRAWS